MAFVYGLMIFAGTYFGVMSVVINPLVFLLIRKLSEPEKLIDIVENGTTIMSTESRYDVVRRWAQEHAFFPEVLFNFHSELGGKVTVVAVWRCQNGHDFLCHFKSPHLTYIEFVTTLGEDSDLTTSNAKLSMLLPTAPQRFVQAFNRLHLDDLFQRHKHGLEHLLRSRQLAPFHRIESAERLFAESIRSQVNHVCSLPLWQLRSTWWYWSRRNLLHNMTIAERYPRG